MKNSLFRFYTILFISVFYFTTYSNEYKKELELFKNKEDLKLAFDEEANSFIRGIQSNIRNYQNLSPYSRLALNSIMALGVVVVTQESMPKLYTYIDSLCAQNNIPMPAVFVTLNSKYFNAFACKILTSYGGIVIGQDILNQCSEEEIEAVVAHEIGHIKHNHINKNLSVALLSFIITICVSKKMNIGKNLLSGYILKTSIDSLIAALIVGKKFEKEADTFACDRAKKAAGLIAFFKRLEQKEQKEGADFDCLKADLLASKDIMRESDYRALWLDYYLAKGIHLGSKGLGWIYHNTPFGPHPSHLDRIAMAQEYLVEEFPS